MIKKLLLLACIVLGSYSSSVLAHKPSDSYLKLTIQEQKIEGQWDIALRDLDFAIGLDLDGNGEVTWDEVRSKHNDISAYALARLKLSSEGVVCPTQVVKHLINDHTDGSYAVLQFEALCTAKVETLEITYHLFSDIDPQHKGLLNVEFKGQTSTAIFSPSNQKQSFILATPDKLQQFVTYLLEGVWHIWIGFDHILFLISLLLPAVLIPIKKQWQPTDKFKHAVVDVFEIVTAFTLAHSITLTLATMQIISLPSRWVESVIAASVVLAALNNIFPLVQGKRWIVAFAFGLIHGFGFASVLSDLGLPQSSLLLALVGFNVGVEVGQLVIVAVFLPIAFAMRKTWFYQKLIFIAGSGLIALIALAWLIERVGNYKFMSF